MNELKKLALAVAAVAGLAGCAGAPVANLSGSGDAPVQVAQKKVTRVLPSYGSLGGYRYRRLVAVPAAS
jgi:hypothetical protein